MATKKITTSIKIENIWVTVTCPHCGKEFRCHMRDPLTTKTCMKCQRVTFVFSITPLVGGVSVIAAYKIDPNPDAQVYSDLKSDNIEIDQE